MDKQYRITREEAIQILSTRDAHGVLCGYTSGVTEAIDMAIDALSAEAVQGWIPCSERLPSEDGCYLVSTTGTNNDIIDIAYYTEEIWHKASRIKAWMPLPKPYREESEVEE